MIYDKDLRIGNFILIDGSTIGTIREIRENHSKVLYQGEVNGSIGKRFSLVDYERIKSIQLTEEWLIRFGFTKGCKYSNDRGFTSPNADFFFEDNINSVLEECGGRCIAFVEYVHQLQNLYKALADEELELK